VSQVIQQLHPPTCANLSFTFCILQCRWAFLTSQRGFHCCEGWGPAQDVSHHSCSDSATQATCFYCLPFLTRKVICLPDVLADCYSDLGVHIDGFIATAAHTLQVPESSVNSSEQQAAPITGKAADVVAAAQSALEAALRLVRPGKHISDVPDVLRKVVEAYGCNLVEGVMSHQMKQFVIDANKCVLNRPSPEHKVEDGEFEENEVYAIDIVVSTGEGKPKVSFLADASSFILLLLSSTHDGPFASVNAADC